MAQSHLTPHLTPPCLRSVVGGGGGCDRTAYTLLLSAHSGQESTLCGVIFVTLQHFPGTSFQARQRTYHIVPHIKGGLH